MGPATVDIERAYALHAHSVFRRARALLGSEDDAREMVHEVFLSLLESPSQFAGRSALSTWLYAATTHRCLNKLRDHKTRGRLLRAQAHAVPRAHTGGGAERAALRELLVALPEDLAAVAVYYYLDEMTQEEVAAALGRSRRHVADLLERLQAAVAAREER